MSIFTSDNFNAGTPGDNLTVDTAWEAHAGAAVYSDAGRGRISGTVSTLYSRKDVAPATADYTARATIRALSLITNASAGVAVRCQTGANTAYVGRGQHTSNTWRLERRIAGTTTLLGSSAKTFSTATDYLVELDVNGTSLELFADGVSVVGPVTDSNITAAGAPGINLFQGSGAGNTTGWHIDNFEGEEAGGAPAESGGSSSLVDVTAAGAGSASEVASGGASSTVGVTAAGAGSAAEQASGGTESVVEVTAAGAGTAQEDGASAGGSASIVEVVAAGAGHAAEVASGGALSVVSVTAAGAGTKQEEGAQQGGSASVVSVTSIGSGVAREAAAGGSASLIRVLAFGAGIADDGTQIVLPPVRCVGSHSLAATITAARSAASCAGSHRAAVTVTTTVRPLP